MSSKPTFSFYNQFSKNFAITKFFDKIKKVGFGDFAVIFMMEMHHHFFGNLNWEHQFPHFWSQIVLLCLAGGDAQSYQTDTDILKLKILAKNKAFRGIKFFVHFFESNSDRFCLLLPEDSREQSLDPFWIFWWASSHACPKKYQSLWSS